LVAEVTVQGKANLRIAYVIQNVDFDLASDVGIPITVKYTLRGLRKMEHSVSLLQLAGGRLVTGVDDISNPDALWYAPLGLTGTRPFKLLESGVRRLQRELGLPYFAFFDSYRFYEACCRCLPRYDLCHEHNGLLSIGAALACVRKQIPYILTMDADPMLELAVLGRPLRGLQALVAAWEASITYKVAKKIVCLSEPAKQHLVEKWQVDPGKISVIPLGVDVELFARPYDSWAIRTQLGLYDAPVIMFVGSFQQWHGLDRLVEGFAQVLRKLPEAKLLLVGDGPARPAVERKIAKLGIANGVIITGIVPHAGIPEMLASADVVTAPYPHLPQELWFSPLKLYEYMAAGKAIVASRAGQIAEVIQNGHTGILCEPGDVDDFAQATIRLLKDPAERKWLGRNARQQAIKHHSWEQYARRLEEIYLSVL
jgi:glycosyltransferase involved in cell wall biosynthesis